VQLLPSSLTISAAITHDHKEVSMKTQGCELNAPSMNLQPLINHQLEGGRRQEASHWLRRSISMIRSLAPRSAFRSEGTVNKRANFFVLRNNVFAFAVASLLGLGVLPTANAGLVNGSFEQPNITGSCVGGGSPPCYALVDASLVPGWKTTATDNLIEIWRQSFHGVTAYDGDQHAELNATQVSTLYQDVSGIAAGSIVGFQFAHRGRLGVDTMAFTLTDLGSNEVLGGGDDTVLFTQQYSDGNTAWGFYTGTGIRALGNTVRFSFQSVSAAGGNQAIGNFLDDADFGVGVGSAPEPSSLALFGSGILAIGGLLRKRFLG
jgi:hypothetical protein